MSETQASAAPRLKVTADLRKTQQDWLAGLQDSIGRGERFAICASDEFEELFHLFGIHALVVNYWHNLIVATGNSEHYRSLLSERGYDVSGMGPFGFAAAIDPSKAPWGGLPKPSIMLGSTRDENEFRFLELWAREIDCPYYPLNFNLASPYKRIPEPGWWNEMRSNWREMVDPDQLALRIAEIERLIAHLEVVTGIKIRIADLANCLTLLNEQMDLVEAALDMIAAAPACPVSLQDQLAMYQAMWHRGTERGRDFARAFHDEVAERVATGARAYEREEYRLLYWSGEHEPRFHTYLREEHGAAFVANLYSASPPLYARDFDPDDPLPALCSRNIFLVAHETPEWMIEQAKRFRCHGIVTRERIYPRQSLDARAAEQAGIPFLSVPHLNDGDDIRPMLDAFIRDQVAPYAARS